MRAFVAIDLDRGLLGRVKEIQEALKHAGADVKFVEPENLHFTVKFLGEIAEKDIGAISNSLEGSVSGFRPFKISMEGVSCFGSEGARDGLDKSGKAVKSVTRRIRTLFLDVKEGRENLQGLLGSVGRALDCFRHEGREASPHLTIGRVRSGRNVEALLGRIREVSRVKVGEMDVKFVKLKQSVLTRSGPVYSDLKAFELHE